MDILADILSRNIQLNGLFQCVNIEPYKESWETRSLVCYSSTQNAKTTQKSENPVVFWMQWTSPCCQWSTVICSRLARLPWMVGDCLFPLILWSPLGIVRSCGLWPVLPELGCLRPSGSPCSPHPAPGWGVWSPSCWAPGSQQGRPEQLWRWSLSFAGFPANACWSLSITHPIWDQRFLPHLSWGARPSVLDAFPCKGL